MRVFSPEYTSSFCTELLSYIQTGHDIEASLSLLCENDKSSKAKAEIYSLYSSTSGQKTLSDALETSGNFPRYFSDSVRFAENTGKLTETLTALSSYCKRRAKLSTCIHCAIYYPLILLISLCAVVAVLITKVLPVFSDIYKQIGTDMSSFAVSLMNFGKLLISGSVGIFIVLAIAAVIILLVHFIPSARLKAKSSLSKRLGDKGIFGCISSAKFAYAMSMAVSSGLNTETAVAFASDICSNSFGICSKTEKCLEYLAAGESLENCLSKSRIFSENDCRLLSQSNDSEYADKIIEDLAVRSEEKVIQELDIKLKKFGPSIVIIVSVLVGLILLSVMLPLIGIMSSI